MVDTITLNDAPCLGILIAAFATVSVGGYDISTPDIRTVVVNRQRGRMKSVARASVFIQGDSPALNASGGDLFRVKFWGNLIFTGVVKRVTVSPSFRCQGESIITFDAEDFLFKLENKKFTRRQKLPGLGPIALISSKKDTPERAFDNIPSTVHSVDRPFFDNDEIDVPAPNTNPRDMTNLISPVSPHGRNHPTTINSRNMSDPRGGGIGGGRGLHDHSSVSQEGPAHGVYGSR